MKPVLPGRTDPFVYSLYDNFVRELVERLYDGCSVTFTIPQQAGRSELVQEVFRRLRQRDCLIAYLDLAPISSIDEFADALTQTYLQLITGNIDSANSVDSLLANLSEPDVEETIRDVVDGACLDQMTEWEKVDWTVGLSEIIAKSLDTRLVVWINEWQEIVRIGGEPLLRLLRATFQHQSCVTYAFTGSRDPDLLRTLFADRHQPFYRFAVELQFVE